MSRTSSEIDIYSTGILFGMILQTMFPTESLDGRFEFLDMIHRMISFSDDTLERQTSSHQLAVPLGELGGGKKKGVELETYTWRCV